MSLFAEIQNNSKKSKIKKYVFILLLIWALGFSYFYFFSDRKVDKNIKEEKITSVKKQTIKTFIEADWSIVLKDEFNLDFLIDWVIKEIYKSPWDIVQKWEKIASLDTTYFDIAIKKAELNLKTAQANYELKTRWINQTELDIFQKQLDKDNISLENSINEIDMQINSLILDIQTAKNDLEMLKKQKEIDLLQAKNNFDISTLDYENAIKNMEIGIKQEKEKYKNLSSKLIMETDKMISNIEKNLYNIDILLWVSDENRHQNDSFEIYLWAKNSSSKTQAENSYRETKNSFSNFYTSWQESKENFDLEDINSFEDKILNLIEINKSLNKTLSYTIDVLKNSISSSSLSQTNIDNYLNNFENALSTAQKDSSDYTLIYQSLKEQKISLDSKIISLQKEIQTSSWKVLASNQSLEKEKLQASLDLEKASQKIKDLENSLKDLQTKKQNIISLWTAQINISKANIDNKKYSDNLELEPYLIAISQAREALNEAKQKRNDAILYAPISWKIAQINWQVWESTNTLKESFAVIIDNSNFYVDSFVEEYDIVKVKNNQDVYINFEAIDGLTLTWSVVYIEDKATIDSNWLVLYKVQISFSSDDERIKDAMSVSVEFITKEAKNVLSIPVSAVKNIWGKPSVILENWNIKEVITWFTDWKVVEVISGLENWEKVKY